jgi:hypothetical protein
MDPKAALVAIIEAENTYSGAMDALCHAINLNSWIENGGFKPRIQLAPHLDDWMRGDRFGDVEGVTITRKGAVTLHVKLDKSGKNRRLKLDQFSVV